MKTQALLKFGAVSLAAMLGTAALSRAQSTEIPDLMNYQAYVTDASNVPLGDATPTNYEVVFRIYNSPTSVDSAAIMWAEKQVVTIFNGNFSVLLGNGQHNGAEPHGALSNVFSDDMRYLGITVDNGGSPTEFTPRQRLVTNAYAYRAAVAEQVGDQLYLDSGQVGIGTTSPAAPLTIRKDDILGKGQLLLIDPSAASGTNAASGVITAFGSNVGSGTTGRLWALGNLSSSDKDLSLVNEISGGELNLGTNGSSSHLVIKSNGDVSIDGNTFNVDESANRVGIGTSGPGNTLSVSGSSNITGDLGIGIESAINKLHVRGVGAAGEGITLDTSSGLDGTDIAWVNSTSTSWRIDQYDEDLRFLGPNGGMQLNGNGRVGIGTEDPRAKLHVSGSGQTINSFTGDWNGGAWMKNSSGNGSDEIDWANAGDPVSDVSIYSDGSIVADGKGIFVATTVNWSDERAKNIVGLSDTERDLETLNRIEVTDFQWIDRTIDNHRPHKKVIAQQILEVFPQAVSYMEKAIPSVYEASTILRYSSEDERLSVTTKGDHELQVGDRVRIITECGELEKAEVLEAESANTFVVKCDHEPKQVFVYGKWVDDYHVVDYDAISMLNVSATQELHQKLKEQASEIDELRATSVTKDAEIAALKERLNDLDELQNRLARIEASMGSETNAVSVAPGEAATVSAN